MSSGGLETSSAIPGLTAGAGRPAVRQLLVFGAFVLLGVLLLSYQIAPENRIASMLVAGSGFAIGLIVLARQMARHYPHARLGSCNAVTLARAGLIACLVVPFLAPGAWRGEPELAWLILLIATAALSLDGVDGFLARRSGLSSAFGGRFDMEVDCVLALILAGLALVLEKAGPFVLLLGLARYLFVAAGYVWPWMQRELEMKFRRKVVCVIQIAVLIALLAPPIVSPVSDGLALVAVLLVAWSFGVDIVWLKRRAR